MEVHLFLWLFWGFVFSCGRALFGFLDGFRLVERPKVTVLGRMRSVDKHPSSQPEVRDKGRDQEEEGDGSIVSRPEQEEG
jgi:hypothetical protein